MDISRIAPWKDDDLEPVMDLWQRVFADRKYDFRMDETGFRQRVLAHAYFDPEGALLGRQETIPVRAKIGGTVSKLRIRTQYDDYTC